MALFIVLLQEIEKIGLDPLRGPGIDAQLEGNAVGRFETDAPDIEAELIGVGFKNLIRARPVLAVDLIGQVGGDIMLLEEDDQVADVGVLGPGIPDVLELGRSDSGYLGHAPGLAVEYVERLITEFGHDAGGQGRPDALDEPAGEIFFDAFEARRQFRLKGGHLELRAEFGAGFPSPRELQPLTGGKRRKRSDDGDFFPVIDEKFQDGIAVVRVEEQHRLDRALECFHGRLF